MEKVSVPAAWYSLRRTLPPWRFEEVFQELTELAPKFKLDEVIIKVDTEEFSHGHPSLEWLRAYQPKLMAVKEALEKKNIVFSINPWITVGHCDRGRDDRANYPGLGVIVGHDGKQTKHCACPLSEVWRNHIRQLWTIYAETKPHIMWIEDDIRTFNHEPVRFGCFCDHHMELFSQRVGQKVTREELVEAMLRPGKPHPWRKEYMIMQREIMIETASFLAKVVHAVSPDTCMGLMSSGPRQHCLEGRDWERFAEAIADGKPLYSRPPMGNYWEDSLRGFYYSHDSIKLTRHVLPKNVIEQTEVENVPFTRFSKSINFTFVEMAISFAYGSHGVTLNMFDHVGTPLAEEMHFGQLLADKKDYLNALAQESQKSGVFRGVQLLHHPEASFCKELAAGADYQEMAEDGYQMMNALEAMGIPTVYDASSVIAVSGQTVRSYSDEEIRQMLHKGVLLDGIAAQVLLERGFGKAIGLKSIAPAVHRSELPYIVSAEELHNEAFGGAKQKYISATLPDLGGTVRFTMIEPEDNCQIISSWVDADAKRIAPAMVAFENEFGGRVVIHAFEYATGVGIAYYHPFRRVQMQEVVRYLAGGKPELLFSCDGAYPLALRKSLNENAELLGAFNLNLDDWENCSFELGWDGALPQMQILDEAGTWKSVPELQGEIRDGVLKLQYSGTVSFRLPLIIKLSK